MPLAAADGRHGNNNSHKIKLENASDLDLEARLRVGPDTNTSRPMKPQTQMRRPTRFATRGPLPTHSLLGLAQ